MPKIITTVILLIAVVVVVSTVNWEEVTNSLAEIGGAIIAVFENSSSDSRSVRDRVPDGNIQAAYVLASEIISQIMSQYDLESSTTATLSVESRLIELGLEVSPILIRFKYGENNRVYSLSRGIQINPLSYYTGIAYHTGFVVNNRVFCIAHPLGLTLYYWVNDFVNLGSIAVITPPRYQVYRKIYGM